MNDDDDDNEVTSQRDARRSRIKAHAMCGHEDEVDYVGCSIISLLLCEAIVPVLEMRLSWKDL